MFRKMRRFKQQITDEECLELFRNEPRGTLAVLGDNDYPYTLPMDFVYDNGKLYFHSARAGHKIDAILKCDKASFCVMDKGYRKEGDWALNIKSVIAFGRVRIVEDLEKADEKLRLLGRKYFPSEDYLDNEMKMGFSRVYCLEFTIEHMTGKLVNES